MRVRVCCVVCVFAAHIKTVTRIFVKSNLFVFACYIHDRRGHPDGTGPILVHVAQSVGKALHARM